MYRIILIFIMQVYIAYALNCSYTYEYKDATINPVTKTVDDYIATVSYNYPAVIPGDYCRHINNGSASSVPKNGYIQTSYFRFWYNDQCWAYGPVDMHFNSWTSGLGTTSSYPVAPGNQISSTNHSGTVNPTNGSNQLYTCPNGGVLSGSTCYVTNECPSSYTKQANGTCKKTITYSYNNMICDTNDKNSQGFGWELVSVASNNGSKLDPDSNANNASALSTSVDSHTSSINLCKRKFQECSMACDYPLILEASTGKCVMSYETDCIQKGMVYNAILNICEKSNQCNDIEAYKDPSSNYCAMDPNCNVVNGYCEEKANKYCEISDFSYSSVSNLCEKSTNCESNQFALSSGYCGSKVYCNNNDLQTAIDCQNFQEVSKTCAPDSRDGNLCYQAIAGDNQLPIDYKEALLRAELSGGYKIEEADDFKSFFCSNDDGSCQFKLTSIAASDDGKSLCFKDKVNTYGCINISSDFCRVSGSIYFEDGIRQLVVENGGKSIVAYNKAIKDENLGSIQSSCAISGKVGHHDEFSARKEIIAAIPNGIDILFWDSYRRGYIGIISFLPTIPDDDLSNGFEYEQKEIMQLYNNNFTGFYYANNATYAVYNGMISKNDCISKITGTSFYIPQAENEAERLILNMLSFVGQDIYNYNDGNDASGSCVVKSDNAKSFNEQFYSKKTVYIPNQFTKYVCAQLDCKEHSCQYNECPNGFSGANIEQNDLLEYLNTYYSGSPADLVCLDNMCDSKKPFFPYCGNNNGCQSLPDVYQQSDGSCVKVGCLSNETFDAVSNKCIRLGCNNSVEKDGKCYKTLEQ